MRNQRKMIYLLLLILWISVIFYMSNQPAEISNNQSNFIIRILGILGFHVYGESAELLNFFIRKIAHFTEYMILAYLTFNVFDCYNLSRRNVILFSILFVFVYASSDEIHQYFVPGRECALRDVIIDTSGGITGIILINFYRKFIKKNR